MKKQISILIVFFSSFSLISCQKQDIGPLNETGPTAAISTYAGQMNEAGTPFKGSYITSFTVLQPPPNLIQRVSGTGTASHLGRSTFESISNVAVSPHPPFVVTGTRTITAANGDQLFTTFIGTSTPIVNGMNGADLQETITGGTGKFVNASGSFTTMARNNFITSAFTADFDGYIRY
ncbi:MAG: hypothetical protein ABIT96_10755 [Ferruginibacter sp.]